MLPKKELQHMYRADNDVNVVNTSGMVPDSVFVRRSSTLPWERAGPQVRELVNVMSVITTTVITTNTYCSAVNAESEDGRVAAVSPLLYNDSDLEPMAADR